MFSEYSTQWSSRNARGEPTELQYVKSLYQVYGRGARCPSGVSDEDQESDIAVNEASKDLDVTKDPTEAHFGHALANNQRHWQMAPEQPSAGLRTRIERLTHILITQCQELR